MASVGRHAVVYAIGNLLSKAVAFLMLPIYTRYLSPADYGVVALIDMTLDVVAIVAGQQIASGIFRFYHKADTDRERLDVIATAQGAMALSYLLVGSATFLAADPLARLIFDSEANAPLIRIAAMSFVLQCLVIVPMAFARVKDRSGLIVSTNMAKLVIQIVLNIVFIVVLGLGIRGVFLSTLFANLAVGVVLSTWTVRQAGLRISATVLRSLVRYGVPLMGMQAATFTMTFADRYFLQAAADEAAVGLYNLAYQFGFLMLIMGFAPVEMVWGPRRFQVAKGPDPGPVLARAFRLINVVVISVGVGIVLFVGDVLRIMTTPPFFPAAALVPIILIAYVFHGWAMMQDLGILVKERTELAAAVNWIAALVALAAFAILVPRYQAYGAALAAIAAFFVRWSLTYAVSQRVWPIRYDWPPVFRLLAVATGCSLVAVLAPALALPVSIALHLVLLVVYGILVWLAAILTPEEKQLIRGSVNRVAGTIGARARSSGLS